VSSYAIAVLCVASTLTGAALYANAAEMDDPSPVGTAELDRLVARAALYPDPLLARILAASTYPLEVVAVHRWLARHRGLKRQSLVAAAADQDWDPAVRGLILFPATLQLMDRNFKWTAALGNVFLAQPEDVMIAIQRVRKRAMDAGTLRSTAQYRVEEHPVDGGMAVVIQPIARRATDWSCSWGRWPALRTSSATWSHDAYHRQGVPYWTVAVAERYGRAPAASTPYGLAAAIAVSRGSASRAIDGGAQPAPIPRGTYTNPRPTAFHLGGARTQVNSERGSGSLTEARTFILAVGLPDFPRAAGQTSFATAADAAQALLTAAEADDRAALSALFGPGARDLLTSGDPVRDRDRQRQFVERAKKRMSVEAAEEDSKRATILIGPTASAFAVPLVNTGGRWRFDAQAGQKELRVRRIGANELDAIALCSAFVSAQNQYAVRDRDRSRVNQYARRFASAPGKKNGLYWDGSGEDPSDRIAELVKQAAAEGYDPAGAMPVPYHGYYFRILTAQGPNAAGGPKNYLTHNLLIGGFGLMAWPSEYGVSGLKSFMVNQKGSIYEKDLGPQTRQSAQVLQMFNPDQTWRPVK
jgi:hypothetical protein